MLAPAVSPGVGTIKIGAMSTPVATRNSRGGDQQKKVGSLLGAASATAHLDRWFLDRIATLEDVWN
jgi:hypothetical protein